MPGGLRFHIDWEPVDETVRAHELRSTWGRLEIWVDDACATLVEDLKTGSVRRSIAVPLYPLAEFIAYNWWTMRFNGREDRPSMERNFRAAGDGFTWPNLEVIPAGNVSAIRWSRTTPHEGDPIRYVGQGHRWVDAREAQAAMSALVDDVISRLDEEGISDTHLQREWTRLAQLDSDEVEFCEVSARLGLDPFSEGVDSAEVIERAFNEADPALIEDFFDAVQVGAILDAVHWVNESLNEATRSIDYAVDHFDLALIRYVSETPCSSEPGAAPWSIGYAAAHTVRGRLGMNPTQALTAGLPVNVLTRPTSQPALTGVGRLSAEADWTNLVVVERLGPTARRFAAARALWHAAQSPDSEPFLLTSAQSNGQRIGRAFAAELLAPAEGIVAMSPGYPSAVAPEDLSLVAEHFQVSEMVIGHQIENQLRKD